jgi:hypothetical protein
MYSTQLTNNGGRTCAPSGRCRSRTCTQLTCKRGKTCPPSGSCRSRTCTQLTSKGGRHVLLLAGVGAGHVVSLQLREEGEGHSGAVILAFFPILRYNNPSLTPLRAQGFGNWPKKFSTSSMACENFWQKPENAIFNMISEM